MQIDHEKFNFFYKWTHKSTRFISFLILFVIVFLMFAVMNESSEILWVIDFLKGTGGLFAIVLSIVIGVYGAVINSLMVVMVAVGMGIVGVFGPAILMSILGVPI